MVKLSHKLHFRKFVAVANKSAAKSGDCVTLNTHFLHDLGNCVFLQYSALHNLFLLLPRQDCTFFSNGVVELKTIDQFHFS